MWQWRSSRHEEWQYYSDIENAMIENAQKCGRKQVTLDNNVMIDLKKNLQKSETHESAEIRRISVDHREQSTSTASSRMRRSDRFCSIPKLTSNETSKNATFDAGDWNGSKFVFEWNMRCDNLESLSYGDIMKRALEGIRLEGSQLGYKQESQWIVDQWSAVVHEPFEKIGEACVRLYTMESFVYHLINTTLRENDLSKVDTLGPFCYLLFQCSFVPEFKKLQFSGRVYRGARLSSSQIGDYERAIGSVRSWSGFTSTSRQRQIAESFSGSTVLFIIDIRETAYCAARAIQNLSEYPHEDEVLIRAGQNFTIDRIKPSELSENEIKTLIYLTIQ